MHPTDSDLLAMLHGELREPAADQVRLHVEVCSGCASRRDAIAREEADRALLLRTLDFPVPPISAAIIRTRAQARRRLIRAAASIGVLTTLVSAAAAMPGSPVRTWLEKVLAPAPSQPAPAAPGPAEGPAADGVEVAAEGALVIELRHPQAAGQFQIAATDRATATARAIGGDVGYRVGPGRVTLDNRTPAARYEITIPRTLANVTVLVGGRILWRIGADPPPARFDTLTFDLSLHQGRLP